ncbi:MAG TPA: SDR family oxidoreductase [Modicisalibacter sp.]|nr:SDR family oxidoreductase [Modicisalibacter sp.]
MALHLKKIKDQIIVITGATTGIGLATTRMAAARGAKLVLAARDENALLQLAEEIRQAGGDAVHVVADVGDAEQVRDIARTARERYGGFDTWINNAGASIFGKMLEVKPEDHRRLFETNYWGVVHGSLEAARHFEGRRERYGGVIINLGSVVSDRALPVQGMYSASKHAVKGFTDAFRMELEESGAPIAVTLIKPSSIATPFPQHAENYMDEEPTLPPSLYDPKVVARAILHCAEVPKRDVYIGGGGRLITLLGHYAPRLTDRIMEATIFRQQRSGQAERRHRFSLHDPATDLRERAKYPHHVSKSSVYTKASLHPLVTATLIAGAALGVAAFSGRSKVHKPRYRRRRHWR